MKNRLVLLIFVVASILPIPAFAASYYFVVTGTEGGKATAIHGPFASLGACQEALARALGQLERRKDVTVSSCYAK